MKSISPKNTGHLIVLFFLTIFCDVDAQLSIPEILSSNMVLQQGQNVPVWEKLCPKSQLWLVLRNKC